MTAIRKRLYLSGGGKWTLLLALLTVAALGFLSRNHAFVSMWAEGAAECFQGLLTMLGYDDSRPDCWLHVGALSLPMALNQYIGPAWFYLYAPTAYLWFDGVTADPYVYRYVGIIFFLASAWILYYLLRNYYKPSISFYSAAAFLTNPVLLLGSLTDHGILNTMLPFILLTVLLFSLYIKSGRVRLLLASALALGLTLLTRIEAVLWLAVPFAIYLLLVRPPAILDRWKQIKQKRKVALSALALFCLGALPVIAHNLLCPRSNILLFTVGTVFRRSFDAGSLSLWEKLARRAEHFWSFNLLGIWPFYEIHTANYVMAVLWVACALILAVRWIKKGRPSLLLVMIPTVVALSILTTGLLRKEHLLILEPAALLVITSALAYVGELGSWRKAAHVAFIALIASNIAVAAIDWRSWNNLPPESQTMLNQSDPVLLARYISDHHASDRILYTNVGIPQQMKYMTVGRIRGEDIMDWTDVSRFVSSVKIALLDKSRRRVFVAVSGPHDGRAGAVLRTKTLYGILDQYNIAYEVAHLSSERNSSLYDVIVVDEGVTLPAESSIAETIIVSDVVSVRVEAQPDGSRHVIGSVIGSGFKPGDAVRINSGLMCATAYGSDDWITFSAPLEALGGQSAFTLEVIRAESLERSRSLTVDLQQ